MNFETKHEVHNGVFETTVMFTEFGVGTELDAAHEEALFEDLGLPVINLGSIVFKGKFKVSADKRIEAAGASDADAADVALIVNNKTLTVGPGFVASYRADAADIADSEVGDVLNSKKLVAEAKCVLFEQKVKEEIKKVVEATKAEKTRFETDPIESLTI